MKTNNGSLPTDVKIQCPGCGGRTQAHKINRSSAYKFSHNECGLRHRVLNLPDLKAAAVEPLTA